eukprot:CAMPEP_0170773322 /NCGR_PEP_ID=MMETSP0733-20121128/9311_1 /TAXON_ID=186038 /ORGANISM="Fragilariopsis kerguelensis, Strain L26-C5" /LENGTH=111 /DNA_ID=CAMNT_0011115701 /DNA_START=194 /DNA_END=527 /DNA_ORIENTATION=+
MTTSSITRGGVATTKPTTAAAAAAILLLAVSLSSSGTANDLMQGTELDGASSCFVAKLDVSDNDEMEAADLESFHTLTNWKSYGDPGVMETCAAITTDDDHNQAFVVGSVA